MEKKILEALNKIHKDNEVSDGSKMPFFEISISDLLVQLKLDNTTYHPEIYNSLESLVDKGLIYDNSVSNGGFGRTIGTDNEMSFSVGSTITLA
ncbi:TPA: hypothetical protein ACPYW1_004230 [Citrobacter freundii]